MNTKEVNEIIQDLYNIDPSLKEYEDKIQDIIFDIYYQKPDIESDDNFKNELKQKLLDRIYELKIENEKSNTINTNKNNNINTIMKKINYILTGVVAVACVFALFIYISNSNKSNMSTSIDANVSIKPTNGSFGQLFSQNNTENTVAQQPLTNTTRLMAGVGDTVSGNTESGKMMPTANMIISPDYVPTIYKYTYDGDKNFLSNLDTSNLPVLKRIKDSTIPFNNSLISTNTIDLSKFGNLKIDNISLNEDKQYGYSLYMSLSDGTFSISKNWAKWPQIDYSSQQTIDDVPSNDDLINISNNFIQNYNINLDNYSSPEIQTDYHVLYAKAADKTNFYIPTSSSVIYPLKIQGKEVYEQYGDKYGITISVNFQEKKVEYVNNIQTLKFESANYDLDTNPDNILKVAENIDNYYIPDEKSNYKTVELKLENPIIAYTKIYNYDEVTSVNNEFFVPAVVFSIDTSSLDTNNYYKKYIVIPLTKEYVDEELDRINKLQNPSSSDNNTPTPTPLAQPREIQAF